jgi:putative peptidoglycan lipid II flippase
MLRKLLSVGGWTLVSRVTGFARDVMMAAMMGAGPLADAFVVALRLPNHFRAIFGEGAFNSAFIPTYAKTRAEKGEGEAQAFAGNILSLMLWVQLAVLALALIFMPQLVALVAPGFPEDPFKFELAVTLTRITFPYLLFVTLVTLYSSLLNAHDRFAAAAAAPVLLNASLIAGLGLAFLFPSAGHAAAWGVCAAGVLELILVWADTRRAGIAPALLRPHLTGPVRHFFKTFLPAVVGSAGVQIAMFADTIIASFLPSGAVSAIYYADRLYQLPIGVIGIAAGTVLLPEMSRHLATGDAPSAYRAQNRTVGLTLILAAPFMVAFLVMPYLIVSALFGRGAFDSAAASEAARVLAAYALGLPAIVLIRSALASFHARSDTVTPLIASLSAVAMNVMLKLILISPFGAAGLALATAIGAWINFILLIVLAWRKGWTKPDYDLFQTFLIILVACLPLALIGLYGPVYFGRWIPQGAWQQEAKLVLTGLLGAGLYSAVIWTGMRIKR